MRELLTFRELPIGAEFCFCGQKEEGTLRGPFVKVSLREYRHPAERMFAHYGTLRVYSTRAEVYSPAR